MAVMMMLPKRMTGPMGCNDGVSSVFFDVPRCPTKAIMDYFFYNIPREPGDSMFF
jgi:hypothetical protein